MKNNHIKKQVKKLAKQKNEDVYNITTGKARIFGEEYDITE